MVGTRLTGSDRTCVSISPILKVVSVCLLMTFLGILRFTLLHSLSSPPLLLLRDIHFKLLTQYDSKEVLAPSQSQVGGTSARPTCQNDIPQQQESAQLSLPQLNRLFEDSFVCDESSVSTADVVVIPYQHKDTVQILIHW